MNGNTQKTSLSTFAIALTIAFLVLGGPRDEWTRRAQGWETGGGDEQDEKGMIRERTTLKSIVLEVSASRFGVAGREMPIELALKNEGTRAIAYGYRGSLRGFAIVILDQKGNRVPLTRWGEMRLGDNDGETGKYVIRDLMPNEVLTININLSRYFDLTMPGTYSLYANWDAEPSSEDRNIKLVIEILNFEVVEPGAARNP